AIIRRYIKNCDKICAVSDALKQALEANGIENVTVVHNGIDVNQWREWLVKAPNYKKARGINSDHCVGFVGKLTGPKGGREILAAMKIVKEKIPDAELLLIGDKERLSGPDLVAAYAACDVIAFPSVCLDTFG